LPKSADFDAVCEPHKCVHPVFTRTSPGVNGRNPAMGRDSNLKVRDRNG